MRFPFVSLSRRQALASMAAAATASQLHVAEGNVLMATLLPLTKHSINEVLIKICVTETHIVAVWREGLLKGRSRLACYSLSGAEQWSQQLDPSSVVFDLIGITSTHIQVVFINRPKSELSFSKYTISGVPASEDALAYTEAALCAAANESDISVLDIKTNISRKRFGELQSPSPRPIDLTTPTIGGYAPPGIIATMHFLGDDLVVLDHVKARTAVLSSDGQLRKGRLSHPVIDMALAAQDTDVESRAATLRLLGKESSLTFPTSVLFAASNGVDSIWIVAKSLNPRNISMLRIDASLSVNGSYEMRIPNEPILGGKPPLLLAVSRSVVAWGFRDGAVAFVKLA